MTQMAFGYNPRGAWEQLQQPQPTTGRRLDADLDRAVRLAAPAFECSRCGTT